MARALFALGGLLATAPAGALTFGPITLASHLNQPLDARLVLSSLDAGEQASLAVHIASPALFQRFDLERSSEVDKLDVSTQAGPGPGQVIVHIRTHQPVREPFVDFLLEAGTSAGRGLREYTVFLNPAPGMVDMTPASAPVAANPARRESVDSHGTNAAQAGAVAAGRYGPVRSGETLYEIAASLQPTGATVAQTASALFKANPQAFAGDMSTLLVGARLQVPDLRDIRQIDPDTAARQLASTAAPSGPPHALSNADVSLETPRAMNQRPALIMAPAARELVDVESAGAVSAMPADGASASIDRAAEPASAALQTTAPAISQETAPSPANESASPVAASRGIASPDSASSPPEDVSTSTHDVVDGGDTGLSTPRNLLLSGLLLMLCGAGWMVRRRRSDLGGSLEASRSPTVVHESRSRVSDDYAPLPATPADRYRYTPRQPKVAEAARYSGQSAMYEDGPAADTPSPLRGGAAAQGAFSRLDTPERPLAMVDPLAFDLEDAGSDSDTSNADDEMDENSPGLRLDLARMYLQMAEIGMAQRLLEEVMVNGNTRQQDTARALLGQC